MTAEVVDSGCTCAELVSLVAELCVPEEVARALFD